MPKTNAAGASFGARLKAARQARGLSVAALAEAAGTTRQHIYRLESGASAEPTLSLLCRLADRLGVRLDDFRPSA